MSPKALFQGVMQTKTLIAAFACLLIVWAPLANAADRARLEAFLKVTGFDVALSSIALSAADAPEMLGLSSSDFGAQWSGVVEDVFDETQMHEMALSILGQTMSDDMLTHAAEFYASSLGQRFVAVENAAHLVEDDAAKQEDGEALVAEDVSAGSKRVAILRQMNDAIGGVDGSLKAVQEIQVRFLLAASNAGVLEWETDEETLRLLIEEGESDLRLGLQVSALASAAYTYQDFSVPELQTYLDALEHPTMRTVYELMNAVQYEIMANRFEALAGRMGQIQPEQEL